MLPKVPPEIAIEAVTGDYDIGAGVLHTRVLNGPRFVDRSRPARTALFLHGGGLGSNFTQVERPARWLIARDLFDQVILPDRRGAGGSSAVERAPALDETADDLRRLLDRMNVYNPLAVLGVDTGGPQALVLAGMDERVRCVGLIASAPRRVDLFGPADWLQRRGLLRRLLAWEIRRSIGGASPARANFDLAYDAHSPREMTRAFSEALRTIPVERGGSLLAIAENENDPQAVSVPDDLRLDIPILQVIGEVDEVWGGTPPPDTQERFPNLRQKIIPRALMHKDVFFKAKEFYEALFQMLEEGCPLVR